MLKRESLVVISFIVVIIIVNWSGLGNEREKAILTDIDFDNDYEGTIIFSTSRYLPKENSEKSDYLVFFASEKIKNLRIIYDFRDFRLKGGIPLISSEEEINFDGDKHRIAYTFKKKGKQALYFDGSLVAKGIFDSKELVSLTGLSIYDNREVIGVSSGDIMVYDKQLTEEEVKEITFLN